jgi:hypothetical protein
VVGGEKRNKCRRGEAPRSTQDVCHRIERHLVDFLSLKNPEKPPKPPDVQTWSKPPDNFDGAYDKSSGDDNCVFVVCLAVIE